MRLVIGRKCIWVMQTLTNQKNCEKSVVRFVYEVSRELSDSSVCSAPALTLIYRWNGQNVGNAVISRPDKPPPEVVLIERQPRRWANRKILSGSRAEPTNLASRGTGALWKQGRCVGGREDLSIPGLWSSLQVDSFTEKLDLTRLALQTSGLLWRWRRSDQPRLYRSKAGAPAAVPDSRTSLTT